eukprot:CAMPEP_0172662462 /NCGR_PEP_ID=MMETSP1074-20121228/5377_1 /TAXON_ID=2916 /ORGANISM="Ceratium fusus, Strain PA161109" /LENGTH=370 /DNA_ID=CAMNT_0013478379 /DNA_START=41 /DNA_END=1153 /DNA_ORIENTATION=+
MGANSSHGGNAKKDTPCCGAGLVGRSAEKRSAATAMSAEPIRVAVSGAAGQIGYSLLPMLASGFVFGPARRVALQCLDLNLEGVRENMRGIEMELLDGNFPMLHSVVFTTDEKVAFCDADYAILLGAYPRQEGGNKREAMQKNVMIFRTIGHAIQEHARETCMVTVVGNPAATNAFICGHFAPRRPRQNFVALMRLDQHRACGQLAQRAGEAPSDVKNVIVWGAHTKTPDFDHCTIRGRRIGEVFASDEDQRWLTDELPKELLQRGASIHKARRQGGAMSTARAIACHVRDLHTGSRSGEFASMGVWSDGNPYGVVGGLVYSLPVLCHGAGRYSVVPGLEPSERCKEVIREAESELLSEREMAKEFLGPT